MKLAGVNPLVSESANLADATASALIAIGVRIKEIRLAHGMTLQTLSEASGLSPSMISLVERGRASPSIGSLVVIASSLGVTMSELVQAEPTPEEKLVVRSSETRAYQSAQHVLRSVLREDRKRGLSVAINEYAANTGSADQPVTHDGFEYGYVLEGQLTVTVEESAYVLDAGDLISYSSHRPHRLWNYSACRARTLWINLLRD